MKKFFSYACGISAIVVAICAVVATVYYCYLRPSEPKTFNVDLSGADHGVRYSIKGNLPQEEVASFIEEESRKLRAIEKRNGRGR